MAYVDQVRLRESVARMAQLPRVQSLIVAHDGKPLAEHVFRGPSLDQPVNIRSASKSILGALVGIAIDRGLIEGVDQLVLPLLEKRAPAALDPRIGKITIDHLLSMRAGLDSLTLFQDRDRWFQSSDWVSHVLSRNVIDEPGGSMIYSTGNMHLLSAILTDASGASTWEFAQRWLGAPLGITIRPWIRDPQGIYFGGDEMLFSPRDLLRFGEMYCSGGVVGGCQVVPRDWIVSSWTPHAFDPRWRVYGYGWFLSKAWGHPMFYAWGLGGQIVCICPSLKLTIVITCDSSSGPALDYDKWQVHQLVTTGFMPAVIQPPFG